MRRIGKGGMLLFLLLGRCSGCGGTGLEGDTDLDLAEVDRQEDLAADDPADDGETEGAACGNGIVEPGEACDTTEEQACTTSCGSSGLMRCEDCEWTACLPPGEACNGIDDDCNGVIDDLSGGISCSDGCCNGGETPCSCPADCGLPPPPPAPLQLAPHNGRRLAIVQPFFRWRAVSGECGSPQYEIQVDDSCTTPGFDACAFPDPEAGASGIDVLSYVPDSALPVDAGPPAGRRYYWRVRACFGASCSPWSAVWYVDLGAADPDFDGDGHGDLAVGAPYQSTLEAPYEGSVYVFSGGTSGIQAAPDVAIENPDGLFDANFGIEIAHGDLNGDLFSDLVIGAPGRAGGKTYIFYGGPGGIVPAVYSRLDNPEGLVDGGFGQAISASGDLNLDGIADLVVAAPAYSGSFPYQGRVFVYLCSVDGCPETPSAVLENPSAAEDDFFGHGLEVARDLDADGFADLVASSNSYDGAAVNEGVASFYRGGMGGIEGMPFLTIENPDGEEGARFGVPIDSPGDLNGDGFDDVVMGTHIPDEEGTGKAYVFFGDAEDLVDGSFVRILDPEDDDPFDHVFGSSLSGLSDVNLDGFDDFSVAGKNEGVEALFVYAGGPSGIGPEPWQIIRSPVPADNYNFGHSFGCIGDVDSDGYSDYAVGAGRLSAMGVDYAGGVFIYQGNGDLLPGTPALTVYNPEPLPETGGGGFGEAIAVQ